MENEITKFCKFMSLAPEIQMSYWVSEQFKKISEIQDLKEQRLSLSILCDDLIYWGGASDFVINTIIDTLSTDKGNK